MIKKLGVSLAAVLLLATAACGSDRPSADELSTSLQKGSKVEGQTVKLPKKQADCLAKLLVDSDISDKALKAIEARDSKYKASKKDTAAASKLESKATSCLK